MERVVTNKRLFGVCILSVLMMSSAGCTDDIEHIDEPLSDEGTEVTLEIYHGSSFEDAEENYTVVIMLYDESVPLHAHNFISHALDGNFNNVTFHRVIDNFMIQGGDFQNHDGTGGYAANWYGYCNGQEVEQSECSSEESWTVPLEADLGLQHLPCTVSMARSSNPNSAGSQFFIVPEDSNPSHLDGEYSVFGKVTEGCEHITTISEVATGQNDRPILPVVIHTATVEE
jgi:peptidyl-prolyl cis-trans isomerase B (cyclophilin B)